MLILAFLKEILSGEIILVLEGRDADLEDGNETVEVTAVAMVKMQIEIEQEMENMMVL